ncbi:MAG: hypothetical protein LBT10_05220 [Methanobrevibacter sp.]|jgi:hypothetical protein|nr:hypothetical protein [Methanobrevibacter sp.]
MEIGTSIYNSWDFEKNNNSILDLKLVSDDELIAQELYNMLTHKFYLYNSDEGLFLSLMMLVLFVIITT